MIKDSQQKLITIVTKVENLYCVTGTKPKIHVNYAANKGDCSSKEDLWHRRYGHLCVKSLQQLSRHKEKSLGQSVKVLRTDNGGDFTSDEFKNYLKKEVIVHQLMIPKYPEQNEVAK